MAPLRFVERDVPLAPAAVVAVGGAARALVVRVLDRSDDALGRLRGVFGPPSLVAFMTDPRHRDELPWADGCVLLGQEPSAPGLLLPTLLRTELDPVLVERALQTHAQIAPPIALLPREGLRCSLAPALPVTRAELARVLVELSR